MCVGLVRAGLFAFPHVLLGMAGSVSKDICIEYVGYFPPGYSHPLLVAYTHGYLPIAHGNPKVPLGLPSRRLHTVHWTSAFFAPSPCVDRKVFVSLPFFVSLGWIFGQRQHLIIQW